MSFPNVYTHRKVADTAAKGCEVCFKPSTSVLITPENKVRRPPGRPDHPWAALLTARTSSTSARAT